MSYTPLIGLTGGIASGKSSVGRLFLDRGAALVDADAIYHSLLQPHANRPSPLAQRIASTFADVLAPDGTVRRAALGKQVFADAQARRTLEAITHPAVREEAQRLIEGHRRTAAPLIVYDVPLLFERNLASQFDAVVVVWVSASTQRFRLATRDDLDAVAIEARLAAQWPLDRKKQMATFVIDNDGSLKTSAAQLDALWPKLLSLQPSS